MGLPCCRQKSKCQSCGLVLRVSNPTSQHYGAGGGGGGKYVEKAQAVAIQ